MHRYRLEHVYMCMLAMPFVERQYWVLVVQHWAVNP